MKIESPNLVVLTPPDSQGPLLVIICKPTNGAPLLVMNINNLEDIAALQQAIKPQ